MKKEKQPIEQIMKWLLEKEVYFHDIATIYTKILEKDRIKYLTQATELANIATAIKDNKRYKKDKKHWDKRYAGAVLDLGIYKGTEYEKELMELL